MKHHRIVVFFSILLLLVAALMGGSAYLLDYALCPSQAVGRSVDASYRKLLARYPDLREWVDSIRHSGALTDTFIMAHDSLRQHGWLLRAPRATGHTAILVHGYTDSGISMLMLGQLYASWGYNLVLPDLHASGQSEGTAVQMGWKDRLDVLRWVALADSLFADSTHHTQQVLHGISMGAATVMMVSGEQVPEAVKCYVEDCGYTSVWDEFAYELKQQFGLPKFPLLYTASWLCEYRYGWNFKEASALESVKHCHRPMLFIHGDSDDFVPSAMLRPLVLAKPGAKEVFVGRGSAHAHTFKDHRTVYGHRLWSFVHRYIK